MSDNPLADTAYTEIASLLPEKQEVLSVLENQTDEIFGLRNRLAYFYRKNRRYFGQDASFAPKKEGEQKRYSLEDISIGLKEGHRLEEFINQEQINTDAEISVTDVSLEDAPIAKEIYRDLVVADFEIALDTYARLREKGGVWSDSQFDESIEDIRKYYKMRWGELGKEIDFIQFSEQKEAELSQKLEALRMLACRNNNPSLLRVIHTHQEELAAVETKRENEITNDPDAYFYSRARALRETKDVYDGSRRIVETPYVKRKIKKILRFAANNTPVFLHGELGSGKTELLQHISRTRLSEKHIRRWEKAHPSPENLWVAENQMPERLDEQVTWMIKKRRVSYSDEQKEWEAKRDQQKEALFLPGHRSIDVDQMLGARTVRRAQTPPPEDQVRIIDEKWDQYRKSSLDGLEEGDVREVRAKKLDEQEKALFIDAYQELFRSPVVAEVAFGPLLQAMREGRPYIEDEMNAIPHHLHIVKNELLTRKPGEWIQPPIVGAEPFQVQDGFVFMGSGNYKPEDGLVYIGRQPMDAAFLSRFGIVAYDYLPMAHSLEPDGLTPEEQRDFRRENELYQMLVSRLLHDDLTLTLPEEGLKSIYRLSMVARHIQDIFSGSEVSQAWYAEVNGAKVKPQDVLKENVLSIRHLLPIIDAWKNDGYSKDLDFYVFQYYVDRSSARPEELLYLYSILKIQGDFFPDDSGWPPINKKSDILKGTLDKEGQKFSVEDVLYGDNSHVNPDLRTYSTREVIEELYGPVPQRTMIPNEYIESPSIPTVSDEIAIEAKRTRQDMIDKIKNQVKNLERQRYYK